jgi:hypothetical protein
VPVNAKLVLNVELNGQPADEVNFFSGELNATGETNRSVDYVPPLGWSVGTYAFSADLYSGGSLQSSTGEQTLEVKDNQPTIVRWNVLAIIVGASVLVAVFTTVIVWRRRSGLIRAWAPDSRV